jgi:GNAT superfamily N-acetyltransferase
MPISIRPAISKDLESAAGLVQRSINDLRVRHGLEPSMPFRPPLFQAFCLSEDPSGLWVADDNGAMVGFGFSWVVADFWYLAQLFIEPGLQAGGVGRQLLFKTLQQAERANATNRALITFAYNSSSTGLYVKHGLYPREPLYRMSAPAQEVGRRLAGSSFDCRATESRPMNEQFGAIDEEVLGFRRDRHHAFLSRTNVRTFTIEKHGSAAGYAYVSLDGQIGPFAVAPRADVSQAIGATMAAALETDAQHLSIIVPGASEPIMARVTELGFRIMDPLVLMAAKPFGNWRNYAPRDPGYM